MKQYVQLSMLVFLVAMMFLTGCQAGDGGSTEGLMEEPEEPQQESEPMEEPEEPQQPSEPMEEPQEPQQPQEPMG